MKETMNLKPVTVFLTKDLSTIKPLKYNFTIWDQKLKDNFVISIPAKEWNRYGKYSDFTIRQWEDFTGHSFY